MTGKPSPEGVETRENAAGCAREASDDEAAVYFDGALPNRIRLVVGGENLAELTIPECEWLGENLERQLAHNRTVARAVGLWS